MANRKATATKLAKSSSANVPKGMKALSGSFAPTWDPEKVNPIQGTFGEPKEVQLKQGNKTVTRRCVEFTTDKGDRFTVWESAGLKTMFDEVEAGTKVYIHFDGYGEAKKGQNAPKLFTVGVDD